MLRNRGLTFHLLYPIFEALPLSLDRSNGIFALASASGSSLTNTMRLLLITIVCALFIAMLGVNLYFRAKVLRAYRTLVQNEGSNIFFGRKRLEILLYAACTPQVLDT